MATLAALFTGANFFLCRKVTFDLVVEGQPFIKGIHESPIVQVRRMHVFSQCAGSVNISFGFGSGNPQIERDLDAAPDLMQLQTDAEHYGNMIRRGLIKRGCI
jgi:hypothetical protein